MSHVTDQRRRARRSRCGRLGGLFAVAVAVAVALFSPRARSAPETFRDIQVEVIGNGRPLLMIPGLNSAGSTWTETCAALQPGVQCHIVQLPGFAGLPPARTEHFLETMRDRLAAYVRDRKLERPAVIGHSLGGALALMMAAQTPGRFERLVIVDSLPFLAALRDPTATPETARAAAVAMRKAMQSAPQEQIEAQLFASAKGLTRSADGAQRIVLWGRTSERATTLQALAEVWATDLRPTLRDIRDPVLVLGSWAAYEPAGATMQTTRRAFESQYAGLRVVTIAMSERGYHFLMWDDAAWLVARVKAFLS